MLDRKLVITKDGSHTVYDPVIKSNFHSTHGAITESKHIFITHGLEYLLKSTSSLRIFEMGFGTGLNAYLSFLFSCSNPVKIEYHALESIPLDIEIVNQLNYQDLLDKTLEHSSLLDFHTCHWNLPYHVSPDFSITKMKCDWNFFQIESKFDLIFFDAFDPVVQPELWNKQSFEKLYDMMAVNAVLCTYCAKGAVRRIMKEVGFSIESLPGPPGKREMTRAIKGVLL